MDDYDGLEEVSSGVPLKDWVALPPRATDCDRNYLYETIPSPRLRYGHHCYLLGWEMERESAGNGKVVVLLVSLRIDGVQSVKTPLIVKDNAIPQRYARASKQLLEDCELVWLSKRVIVIVIIIIRLA